MARYLPLPDRRHVRVIQLEAAAPPGECRGALSIVSLDHLAASSGTLQSSCQYDAVSYVWGEADECHEIILNGWSCSIRKNLWAFLVQYQNGQSSSTRLWIDALCINQKDTAERNNQVQLMSEIYTAAQNVLVWLGPAEDDSDMAMVAIEGRSFIPYLSQNAMPLEEAILKWSLRDYWFRTWIIQEFLLARNIKILCGSMQVSSTAAEKFYESLQALQGRNHGRLLPLLYSSASGLLRQRSRSSTYKAPLLDLLVHNRKSLCSEPHDKIFAMLGLASDCSPARGIFVDYSRAVRYLFADVLKFCNVLPKDVFRYGYFLKRLLSVEKEEQGSKPISRILGDKRIHGQCKGSSSGSSKPTPWASRMLRSRTQVILNVTGFKTGRIVKTGQLTQLPQYITQQTEDTSSQTNTAVLNEDLDLNPLTDGQYSLRRNDWSKMCEQLDVSDMRRLSAPHHLLHAISDRSFPAAASRRPPANRSSAPSLSSPSSSAAVTAAGLAFAVVYFPGHASQEFMTSLTFGLSKKGDHIVQFPGYDVAMTMSGDDDNNSPRLTGRIICLRRSGSRGGGDDDDGDDGPSAIPTTTTTTTTTDNVTFEPLKYYSIQSPAESRISPKPVSLLIDADELIELVG